MEKIYLVVEHYVFEGQIDDIKTTAYKSKESAVSHFNNQVHREKVDSWIATKKNVIENIADNYYEAFVNGYAMEYCTTIYVKELEILS